MIVQIMTIASSNIISFNPLDNPFRFKLALRLKALFAVRSIFISVISHLANNQTLNTVLVITDTIVETMISVT